MEYFETHSSAQLRRQIKRFGVLLRLETPNWQEFIVHFHNDRNFHWDTVCFRVTGFAFPTCKRSSIQFYDLGPSPFTLSGCATYNMVEETRPEIDERSTIQMFDYACRYYVWQTLESGLKRFYCQKSSENYNGDENPNVERYWISLGGELERAVKLVKQQNHDLTAWFELNDSQYRETALDNWEPRIDGLKTIDPYPSELLELDYDNVDDDWTQRPEWRVITAEELDREVNGPKEEDVMTIVPQSGRLGPEIQKKRDERQVRFQESQAKEDRSDYKPKVLPEDLEKRRQTKIQARAGYKKRFVINKIPALLDRRKNKDLTPLERLRFYNKRHKCVHKLSFNVIGYDKQGNYQFSCDHDGETRTPTEYVCQNCAQERLVSIHKETACECSITECPYCKLRLYTGENNETLYQVTPTAVEVYENAGWEVVNLSKKRWYEMPGQQAPVLCHEKAEFHTTTTAIICCCDAARQYRNVASMQMFMHKYIKNTRPWKNRAAFQAELRKDAVEVVDLDALSKTVETKVEEPEVLDQKTAEYKKAFLNLVIEYKKTKQRGKQISAKKARVMAIVPQAGFAGSMLESAFSLVMDKIEEFVHKGQELLASSITGMLQQILARVLRFFEGLKNGMGKLLLFVAENAWLFPTIARNLGKLFLGNIDAEVAAVS